MHGLTPSWQAVVRLRPDLPAWCDAEDSPPPCFEWACSLSSTRVAGVCIAEMLQAIYDPLAKSQFSALALQVASKMTAVLSCPLLFYLCLASESNQSQVKYLQRVSLQHAPCRCCGP